MDSRINNDFEQIDHRTCASICDAVGERLQQNMRPETGSRPICSTWSNELRRRDERACINAHCRHLQSPISPINGLRLPAGSGDKAACFPSPIFRSGSPDGF